MNPDKAQQALATTEVDISQIEPGNQLQFYGEESQFFLKEEQKKK